MENNRDLEEAGQNLLEESAFIRRTWFLFLALIVSCSSGPTEGDIQTAIAQTETSRSSEPSVASETSGAVLTPTDPSPLTNTRPPEIPEIMWTSIGPSGGGWLTALAYAPPDSIYVGSDVGGVYRSTDGGGTWEIINKGLKQYSVTAIAVDPQTPTTVYLGTYGGIYKSTDSGDHWEPKRNGFPPIDQWSFSAPIASLAIDANLPTMIYAGIGDSHTHRFGQGTIYKSSDGGESWRIINQLAPTLDDDAIVYGIALDPGLTDTLYASTDYGLYKSMDGGVTWELRNIGLPHINTRKIIINPFDSNILYLTIHAPPNQKPWLGGVYKSIDGGDSWVPKVSGLGKEVGFPGEPDLMTSNYEQIVIDPLDPNVLYVGDFSWTTAGVYKTINGGEQWTNTITNGNWHPGWLASISGPSVECLLIDPINPSRLYFGDTMELSRSDDGGESWWQTYSEELPPGSGRWGGRGLETTVVYDITIDPSDSNILYFGFADVGLLKSVDRGTTYKRIAQDIKYEGNIFNIILDPENTNILYASSGMWEFPAGEVVKSVDSGENWTIIGNTASGLPDTQVFALVLDYSTPVNRRTLYAASYEYGVYKKIEGEARWAAFNEGLESNGNLNVSSLVMDPLDPNTLYAGVDMEGQSERSDQYGGIYKTTNGGLQWSGVLKVIPNVHSLAIRPDDPLTIYAGVREHYDHVNQISFDGGVYRSTDGGKNWDLTLANPFVAEVTIDPHDPRIIYAGTADNPYHDESSGQGVFRSLDGGSHWHAINTGLPSGIVFYHNIMRKKRLGSRLELY